MNVDDLTEEDWEDIERLYARAGIWEGGQSFQEFVNEEIQDEIVINKIEDVEELMKYLIRNLVE